MRLRFCVDGETSAVFLWKYNKTWLAAGWVVDRAISFLILFSFVFIIYEKKKNVDKEDRECCSGRLMELFNLVLVW